MKIFIMTDLEGPCMVSRWHQTRIGETDRTLEKQTAMTHLTQEVNCAVDGILDVDPTAEIVVWDGHGSGGIDLMQFHPGASLIARGPIGPPYTLDQGFDAMLFVGQHAMAGTPAAPLCHTYSSRTVEWYKLNGEEIGEFGCRAVLAGSYGVPTIFLSGDDKACTEARALVPAIYTVETKLGLGIELAQHHPVARVRAQTRSVVAEAVRHLDTVPPARVEPPYHFASRVLEGCSIDGYLKRPGVTQVDDRTVEITTDNLCDLWI